MKRPLLLALVCLLLIILSPWVGPSLDGESGNFVLWQLRIPRTLMAIGVGCVLSLTGAVYQTLFANALATPSTVGTSAGAVLGALVAVVLLPDLHLDGLATVTAAAFVGAVLVTLPVAAIAASGRARIHEVLLAGIAGSLAAGALASGLQFSADMLATFRAIRWSLGSLAQVGYDNVIVMACFAAIVVPGLLSQTRSLQVMAAGAERAQAQGVNTRRVRTLSLCLGALGVSAAVALCGPIAFVGLIVPHLVRLVAGASRHRLLPLSAIAGAAFLAICDALARVLLPGRELPVGVLTAGLGAPLIVWLVTRRQRG